MSLTQAPKYSKAHKMHQEDLEKKLERAKLIVNPALEAENVKDITLVQEEIYTLDIWDGKVADAIDEAAEVRPEPLSPCLISLEKMCL